MHCQVAIKSTCQIRSRQRRRKWQRRDWRGHCPSVYFPPTLSTSRLATGCHTEHSALVHNAMPVCVCVCVVHTMEEAFYNIRYSTHTFAPEAFTHMDCWKYREWHREELQSHTHTRTHVCTHAVANKYIRTHIITLWKMRLRLIVREFALFCIRWMQPNLMILSISGMSILGMQFFPPNVLAYPWWERKNRFLCSVRNIVFHSLKVEETKKESEAEHTHDLNTGCTWNTWSDVISKRCWDRIVTRAQKHRIHMYLGRGTLWKSPHPFGSRM